MPTMPSRAARTPSRDKSPYRPSNHPDNKVLLADFEDIARNHFPLENLRTSVMANGRQLREAACALFFGAEMPARLIHALPPDEEWMGEFRRHGVMVALDLEAAFALNKSLILARYGSYGLAFSGLRGGAELFLRGIALNQFAQNVEAFVDEPASIATTKCLKDARLDAFRLLAKRERAHLHRVREDTATVTAWLSKPG